MTVGQTFLQAAKLAVPCSLPGIPHFAMFNRICDNAATVIISPPGSLCVDSLARVLKDKYENLVWLRLGPEDKDPATLLLSLISVAQQINPSSGLSTLQKMRSCPGEVYGWQPLFRSCGQELAEIIPVPAAVVIDHTHHLSDPPLFGLLSLQVLALLPVNIPKIIISHIDLPTFQFAQKTIRYQPQDLAVNYQLGEELRQSFPIAINHNSIQKILFLVNGRAEFFRTVLYLYKILGVTPVEKIVARAKTGDQFLAEIAVFYRMINDPNDFQSLALTCALGYNHPEINQAITGVPVSCDLPWYQYLQADWSMLRGEWTQALCSAFRMDDHAKKNLLNKAASYMILHDDFETAEKLYFDLGDFWKAGQMLERVGEKMLDYGQWQTFEQRIAQLPLSVVDHLPLLTYLQAEIQAATSKTRAAQHNFSIAARNYSRQHDNQGVVKSLLAESTLALWEEDTAHAQILALKARTIGQSANLEWLGDFSAWQLGCVNAYDNQVERALDYFEQVEKEIGNPNLKVELDAITQLLKNKRELQHQKEAYVQALLCAERSEDDVTAQIVRFVGSQAQRSAHLLNSHGWSNVPILLKLSPPARLIEKSRGQKQKLVWWDLLETITRLKQFFREDTDRSEAEGSIPATSPVERPVSPGSLQNELQPSESMQFDKPTTTKIPLVVHMLGSFSITIGEIAAKLPNSRSLSLLKYLFLHHQREIPREVLMDTFWPDAEPDAARNNLNVAMHTIRQIFHVVCDESLVGFENGAYHLNSSFQFWLDVEEFENHQKQGQFLDAKGQHEAAIGEYEIAMSLYKGDFLQDDPYEDWSILTRERLRIAFIDLLNYLSHLYFAQKQYAASIALCKLILIRDNCREDIHCLLMRCYACQGQQYLALRQYQICAEALQGELDIEPAGETTQLRDRIRLHESI